MEIALIALLVVIVAALAALVAVIVAGKVWVRRVENQLTPEIVQGARVVGRGRILTVEILNPLEVAAAQNRFGGIAGSLAPALITKVVYDRAARIMRAELGKFGVEALVVVRNGAPAASIPATTNKPVDSAIKPASGPASVNRNDSSTETER